MAVLDGLNVNVRLVEVDSDGDTVLVGNKLSENVGVGVGGGVIVKVRVNSEVQERLTDGLAVWESVYVVDGVSEEDVVADLETEADRVVESVGVNVGVSLCDGVCFVRVCVFPCVAVAECTCECDRLRDADGDGELLDECVCTNDAERDELGENELVTDLDGDAVIVNVDESDKVGDEVRDPGNVPDGLLE